MESKSIMAFVFLFAMGIAVIRPAAAFSVFCSMFSNNQNLVTNSFNLASSNPAWWENILALSVLTILAVFAAISVAYAIGMAFGINKLVTFCRAEYGEGIFTLVIIAMVGGSTAYIGHALMFMSSLATVGMTTPVTSVPSGAQDLYSGLCNNIILNDVAPDFYLTAAILLKLIPYEFIQSFSLSIQPDGPDWVYLLPSVTYKPFGGLGVMVSATFLEFSTLSIFIFLGITLIFLFMLIYLLFPLFLYLGILLRSFPWTRAAGGSFIALFIAFYIVFPVLFYPFTAMQQSQISAEFCGSAPNQLPCPSGMQSWSPFFSGLLEDASGAVTYLSSVFTSFGSPVGFANRIPQNFVSSIDDYAQSFSNILLELLGLGISFIISFDLMEVLADFLGAPSLQGNRILEKVI